MPQWALLSISTMILLLGFSSKGNSFDTDKSSLSDFLLNLHSKHPKLFKQQNIVYESKSLQSSNPALPRIINKDPEKAYYFTFNLDPLSSGYHEIEIMEWNQNPDAFRNFSAMRYLQFERKKFGNLSHLYEIKEKDEAVCMRCHGSPLKPIWKSYDFWDGNLGSMDDVIVDLKSLKEEKREALISSVLVNVGSSKKNFDRDLVVKTLEQEFNIYSYLYFMKDLASKRNFFANNEYLKRFFLLEFNNIKNEALYINSPRKGDSEVRPNLRTTEELVQLNSKRIHQMLLDTENCYENGKDILLAALLECSTSYETRKNIQKVFDYVEKRIPFQSELGYWSEAHQNQSQYSWKQKELIIQVFSLFGIEKEDLNLEMDARYWSYFDGTVDASSWIAREIMKYKYPYWSDDLSNDKYSKPYDFNWDHYLNNPNYCYKLDKNLKLLAETIEKNPSIEICKTPVKNIDSYSDGIPDVVSMCESCHSNGMEIEAPFIDFHSLDPKKDLQLLQKIKSRITLPLGHRNHMPPSRHLMRREKKALMDYLGKSANTE